ncbi:MAG: extracellular solute-binding protein [Betaproteobacteria bacterium]|nr:extracellular solute-binding protein [Betaproteobacteria bacterium]
MRRLLKHAGCAVLFALAMPLHAATPPKAGKQPVSQPSAAVSEAADEIELAHTLQTNEARAFAILVERFNQQNEANKDAMRIKLVHLGGERRPAPLSLLTPGTVANFLRNKATFKPVHQVMQEAKITLPVNEISPNLLFGQDRKRISVLPIAFTTPVLFYNKRLFRQAGLDPEKPPQTWQAMQQMADTLMDHGVMCPYTSSWPVWVHLDNLSAISGVPIANSKGRLEFNGLMQVKHIAMLASWHKAGFFRNYGRTNEADRHFYSGECAMITTNVDANRYFSNAPGVELGVAPLPSHDDLYNGPQHTLAAGASLWVGTGYKAKTYRNIARFMRFLIAPDVQIEMARVGFLPLTEPARHAISGQLLRDEERVLEVAYASLKDKGAISPLRISALDLVRVVVDEELEHVWAGEKSAKAALDRAVSRGNSILTASPVMRRALPQ